MKDYSHEPQPVTTPEVVACIQKNDLMWYASKRSRPAARKQILEETGVDVSSKVFIRLVYWKCEWYCKRKRKPRSKHDDLSAEQWDRLRNSVAINGQILFGVGIGMALQIMLSKVSTNTKQLNGLPARCRVWG